MKKSVVVNSLLIFLLGCSSLFAQVVEGLVIDRATMKALPYVNIALLGSTTGTVSKFDGSFRIDLTENKENGDSLAFSIIGYEKKVISASMIVENKKVFLNPMAVNLESVIVSPKSPEEFIQMAIDAIPNNYIDEAFNGTVYYRSELRLNGMFIESSEAILKGYIMPVVNNRKDSTRIKMLAYKYFDEQEAAINSISIQKRKKEKLALDGLDTTLIDLTYQLSEFFDVYTQIDSNLIKQLHLKGHQTGKEKYWFENMVQLEDRNLYKIGFRGRLKMASQKGNLLLDEESLAFTNYNYQVETSNLKIKALLWVMGIGFKKADAVIRFTSIPTEKGWIPDVMEINVFVNMEKNRWFAKDIPIVIELTSHMSFLDVNIPADDKCLEGNLVKKKKHLKEQFKSDPNNIMWSRWSEAIEKRKRY